MDIENIWSVFLEKIEMKVKPVLFQTWFKDTKLINLNNNTATVIVPLDVHKKHLKEIYEKGCTETLVADCYPASHSAACRPGIPARQTPS